MNFKIYCFKTLLLVLVLSSCGVNNNTVLKHIANSTFEIKNISRGNNKPDIDISKDSLDLLLIALHYKIPMKEIEHYFHWDSSIIKKHSELLVKNGLLKKSKDSYIPSVAVFPLDKGNSLILKSQNVASEIADSIVSLLPQVKSVHNQMDISKKISFYDLSFFYLSGILLDMGQIEHVEKEFFNEERPLRNGKQYYLAILERDSSIITEPFGIYGNQGLENTDSIYIGVYGNTRTKSSTSWYEYKGKKIHYFNKKDFDIFYDQMPKIFLNTLIDILKRNKPFFVETYKELGYDREVTFNEFFIWWYHFIYSETTQKLIHNEVIKNPKNGLFYYQIEK